MANKESAKKMVRKIARRTLVNKSRRSSVRSFMRRANEAISFGEIGAATEACRKAESVIQKAKSKGVFHGNTASRTVSRLSKRLKNLMTSA
ncbi:30S ribosomal protein S20 [Candidatus Liberibacter africanus]|uniref:Small ribosomal subunit protein bS20 n=1 Tax=Candidatus Liberibacter africanus PTSAPSY TaxID=1277257 RepID=A0A0G3I321_LIBAF|nr:30S ribosomal protein S20 [Candidatus Liberibacter africanus]AKK20281.1 30S ribosomal protein S20 [Candidatus Liberibacter africanus PTSAPSY]